MKTYQQEGYPGTVVTEMVTDLFSSKYSQCQLSEAEPVENSIYKNITMINNTEIEDVQFNKTSIVLQILQPLYNSCVLCRN